MVPSVEGLVADHLRHSGLRTIRGGISCGGRRRFPTVILQRLLGYQRRKKSFVFRRKPSFFGLLNMCQLVYRREVARLVTSDVGR